MESQIDCPGSIVTTFTQRHLRHLYGPGGPLLNVLWYSSGTTSPFSQGLDKPRTEARVSHREETVPGCPTRKTRRKKKYFLKGCDELYVKEKPVTPIRKIERQFIPRFNRERPWKK